MIPDVLNQPYTLADRRREMEAFDGLPQPIRWALAEAIPELGAADIAESWPYVLRRARASCRDPVSVVLQDIAEENEAERRYYRAEMNIYATRGFPSRRRG